MNGEDDADAAGDDGAVMDATPTGGGDQPGVPVDGDPGRAVGLAGPFSGTGKPLTFKISSTRSNTTEAVERPEQHLGGFDRLVRLGFQSPVGAPKAPGSSEKKA